MSCLVVVRLFTYFLYFFYLFKYVVCVTGVGYYHASLAFQPTPPYDFVVFMSLFS